MSVFSQSQRRTAAQFNVSQSRSSENEMFERSMRTADAMSETLTKISVTYSAHKDRVSTPKSAKRGRSRPYPKTLSNSEKPDVTQTPSRSVESGPAITPLAACRTIGNDFSDQDITPVQSCQSTPMKASPKQSQRSNALFELSTPPTTPSHSLSSGMRHSPLSEARVCFGSEHVYSDRRSRAKEDLDCIRNGLRTLVSQSNSKNAKDSLLKLASSVDEKIGSLPPVLMLVHQPYYCGSQSIVCFTGEIEGGDEDQDHAEEEEQMQKKDEMKEVEEKHEKDEKGEDEENRLWDYIDENDVQALQEEEAFYREQARLLKEKGFKLPFKMPRNEEQVKICLCLLMNSLLSKSHQ